MVYQYPIQPTSSFKLSSFVKYLYFTPELLIAEMGRAPHLNLPTTPCLLSQIYGRRVWFMAITQSEPVIPARCWIAPDIPHAICSFGLTVFLSAHLIKVRYQPASTAALEAPTAPPMVRPAPLAFRSSQHFLAPPATTTSASSASPLSLQLFLMTEYGRCGRKRISS